jgi:hypothetical protein
VSAAATSRNLFSDDLDSSNTSITNAPPLPPLPPPPPPTAPVDLISPGPVAVTVPVEVPPKKSDLFGDDGDLFVNKPKAAAPVTAKKSSGLFGDDDDDGLFGAKPKVPAASSAPVTAVAKKSSLFGDDDDNDLFGGGTKKETSSATTKKGLFDD